MITSAKNYTKKKQKTKKRTERTLGQMVKVKEWKRYTIVCHGIWNTIV